MKKTPSQQLEKLENVYLRVSFLPNKIEILDADFSTLDVSTGKFQDNHELEIINESSGLIGFDRFTGGNMCHVVFDHLSRVLEVEHNSFEKVYFLDSSWAWARHFIDALVPNRCYMKEGVLYKFKELYMFSNATKGALGHPNFVNCTKAKAIIHNFARNDRDFDLGFYPSKIYLSRGGRGVRAIHNETDIEKYLSKLGFFIFQSDCISIESQLDLFANAQVIISPHGAGLSNIISCRPNTKILEIFNDGGTLAYEKIAFSQGLDYSRIELSTRSNFVEMKELCDLLEVKGIISEYKEGEEGFVKILNEARFHTHFDFDVELIRDAAIQLESKNINMAYHLMSIAKLIRPSGPTIINKIKEYENILK